ncbi:MAG TPA: helicase-associated domain-containing protein [Actinophytocola sp.]|uniref:helicase-associated domain-containing protein n=1 Tax=Actinophytocola sp. TaxID=1872138 RepID=UPI002DB9D9FD|nr:helicase-associated domain-containing protein [Actinophytocola sp.]HEU5471677.1 helicase-associated domain-containing protein [Actinophytocola sp.]
MPGPTLTQWLRDQPEEMLVALLRARPDLGTPPPADSSVLAARAGARASVTRAAEGLNTFVLAVLDALLLADADREPAPLTAVTGALGIPAERAAAGVDRLRALAIAWGEDTAIALVPAARDVGGPFPGGLGRSVPELTGADIPALLAGLSDAERRLLGTLAHGQPVGRTRDAADPVPLEAAQTPVQRLLALGLLLRRDEETVELPREVGLVLRGDSPLETTTLDEPELRSTANRPSTVDATAAGEALELVRRMETLLTAWTAAAPPVLKSGGLGQRDVRRLARELDTDERHAGLLAELAAGAGLVADSSAARTGTSPEWVPTTQADAWLGASPAGRWAALAVAWLDLPRMPGLAGIRDDRDRLLAPLSDDLRRPPAPVERRRVLGALAALPAGTGVAPDDLVADLAWRAPRRGGRLRDEIVRWTLAEATALGLVALGALSSPAHALLEEGPASAAKRMTEAMPAPIDHVLVQADLTVVAPGPLEPDLAAQLGEAADVESAGSATVYRITEASVRRALDAGRTGTELHELFTTRSRTPVPQALRYLIDDVARRHGRLRGGAAASFLRCDDPALLAEIVAQPISGLLELRRIAPTVLVSPVPLVAILEELRAAGYTPVAEGPDGAILDLRQQERRLPAPARNPRSAGPPRPATDDALAELVRTLRSGDRAAQRRRGPAVSAPAGAGAADTAATVALLREAIAGGRQVWIWFVDAHGSARARIVDPFRVGGGLLEGRDVTDGAVRQYPLHRITSAALVED